MHGGTIFPDDQIASPPFVLVDEFRLSHAQSRQVTQQCPSFWYSPFDHARGMRSEIQRPLLRSKERSNERMHRTLKFILFLLREFVTKHLT